MIIAVIPVKEYSSVRQQIRLAIQKVDAVELRLDYLDTLDLKAIAELRNEFNIPMIFTLRKKSQGGFYKKNENQRLIDIKNLCQLKPDYIDLEYDVSPYFLKNLAMQYPDIKFMGSYHNFDETPADLISLFKTLQNPHFFAYKIATYANSTLDALRMLNCVKTLKNKYRFTGLCMGKEGQCTRILSPVIGNAMHYVSLDGLQTTAPGQLTIDELFTRYHFKNLNVETKIYALMGDPVHLSVGYILHNQAIEYLQENAVYIHLRVTSSDLPKVIEYCRSLPFAGFSITMPLKESIVPLLDEIEPSSVPIKSLNSILVHGKKYIGLNTDGIGAMQVLAEKVELAKQKIAILGAGGAARAIAYEAIQRKAKVVILNRTLDKAKKLADEFGCEYHELNSTLDLKKINYTVLINTLPIQAYDDLNIRTVLQAHRLLPQTVAMDIVYMPVKTPFLSLAQSADCFCIPGYKMYIYQALGQIKHWFQPADLQLAEIKSKMEQYFLSLNKFSKVSR